MADELDQRLRHLLSARADNVMTQLDGPTLRAAAESTSPLRRIVAPLLLAAAIIVLALTPALLGGTGSHSHREQPGGGSVSVSVPTRPNTPPPSTSPSSVAPTAPTPSSPTTSGPLPTTSPTSVLSPPAVPSSGVLGTVPPASPEFSTSIGALIATTPPRAA